MPPASVAKAITGCYAIETLGANHRFATRILATGPVSEGRLDGDLILAGGGDPTLDTDALAELARRLKASGVFEVTGKFRVWGGALPFIENIDPGQPVQVGYSPAVSGLNLNFNRVHFEWRRAGSGYTVTMDARSADHRPDVRFARMEVIARETPIYTYENAEARDRWTVAKGALGEGGARWLPVRKPELYAAEVFQTFARAHGIVLGNPDVIDSLPSGTELARVESAELTRIVVDMLRYSTNLTAEVLGLSATRALGKTPQSLAESAQAMSDWLQRETDLEDVGFVDHSGLGDQSRISARGMAQALFVLRKRLAIKSLMKSFAMRDDKGRVLKDHPINVLAKTGTLNFVSGLSGFAELPDGTEVIFAIFAADTTRRAGLTRAERERPPGGRSWNRRAKTLQQALIERWSVMYSA